MIEVGGQGVLKRKNYWLQVSVDACSTKRTVSL